MSLPIEVYIEPVKHPEIASALARADSLVRNWLQYGQYAGEENKAAELVVGWTAVDLQERIAEAILEARGYDVEELRALIDRMPPVPWAELIVEWKPTLRCRCGAEAAGLDFDGSGICDACAQKRADEAWAGARTA